MVALKRARGLGWLVVALAGCGPALAPAPLAVPGAGGARDGTAERTAAARFELGLGLLSAGEHAKALREGFNPAIAWFRAAVPEGATVRAVRSSSPALTLMRVLCTGEPGILTTGSGASARPLVVTGPEHPDAHFFRALCLAKLERLEEAEGALVAALALMPQDVVYSSELGHLRHQHRDWAGALARFDDALEGVEALRSANVEPTGASMMGMSLSDWHRRALRGRGFSLIELGRLDDAEAAYGQALAIDQDDARARRELEFIGVLRRQGLTHPADVPF